MSDGTKSPTSTEFSVLVLMAFLLKLDIVRLAMLIQLAIWWWRSSKIPSSTVVDMSLFFSCHLMILSWKTTTPNFFCYFSNNNKKLTDDSLTISVTFTWFYKTENVVV